MVSKCLIKGSYLTSSGNKRKVKVSWGSGSGAGSTGQQGSQTTECQRSWARRGWQGLEYRMTKVTLAGTGLGWLRFHTTLLGQTGVVLRDVLHWTSGTSCNPRALVHQETLLRCTVGPCWDCDFELQGDSGFL